MVHFLCHFNYPCFGCWILLLVTILSTILVLVGCWGTTCLKTVDTIGTCNIVKDQSSHLLYLNVMHKITTLWKFQLNRSSKLRDNKERKNTLVTRSCVLSEAWFRDLKLIANLRSRNQIRGKLLLSRKLYVTSEGAVSHNVLCYQPLPITRYLVSVLW